MRNIKNISLAAMLAMAAVSFINLFGIVAAGISVLLGVAFFFINKKIEGQAFEGSGLDFKAIGGNLKENSIWFWIAMPLVMDIVSIALAKLILPEYIDHVLGRAGVFVSFGNLLLLLPQLAFLALGEEIAWRAFFQKQLSKALPIMPVLLISSVLFGIGHLTAGNTLVVAYDVFFVAVNSFLYGVIFYKSNNAWISTISHFAANLFSVIVLVFL